MKRTAAMFLMMTTLLAGGAANAAPAGWKTYTDPTFSFSIATPPGWKVETGYASAALGPDHPIPGVAFHIPPGMAKGTNLSADNTFLAVEHSAGAGCGHAMFLSSSEDPHVVKADGRRYDAAEDGDAGAGNFYDTRLFVLTGTTPCMAVRYFIHSTNIGNYDPGTIRAFDEKKLIAAFDSIRATLTLKK
jgi:hypothetical protein